MAGQKTHYKAPGIYTERVADWSFAYELIPTGIPTFIGSTARGPVHKPLKVRSVGQFNEVFGRVTGKGYLAGAIDGYFQNGGGEAYVLSLNHHDSDAEVRPKDYLGHDKGPDDRAGLFALQVIEDSDLLVLPDLYYHVAEAGSFDGLDGAAAVQNEVVNFCESLGDRTAILDAPKDFSVEQIIEWSKRIDSSYAALYYPWLSLWDGESGEIAVPPSGYVAGQYSRFDRTDGVHRVAANWPIEGILGVEQSISRREQEGLNPLGINCIRPFPGRGTRVWGGRTMSSDPSWRYINVRRIFNVVEKVIELQTQWAVFEPNDRSLWKTLNRGVSIFLKSLWKKGYLIGDTANEAFYVKCDDETNPPEDRDRGFLTVEVGLAPVVPAEFIVLRVRHQSGLDTVVEEDG